MSDKHTAEISLEKKKVKFVTSMTMKVRDHLYTKLTKLQNDLENQIAAGQKSADQLKSLKEERDEIECDLKKTVKNQIQLKASLKTTN